MHTLRHRALRVLALSVISIVGGCVIPPETTEPGAAAPPVTIAVESGPQDPEVAEVITLLGYFQRMSGLSAEELRREYNSVNQLFSREKDENQRLKLAMLMSIPGAAFRDDARLLSLLETSPLRNARAESPQRELLTLLHKLTADRVRVAGQAKEEQRRIETQAKDEQKRLEQQVKEEQQRADELQKKLDALLAIDRELRQRSPQRGTHRSAQPQ